MRHHLAANLVALGSILSPSQLHAQASQSEACQALTKAYPNKTFSAGSNVYNYETQHFWSNTEILSPGPTCVFRPESAQDVAWAVEAAAKSKTQFAVRGGGHMGIAGANNINDGPLIVMSNLTTLELGSDKKHAWIGPGKTWGDVYQWLGQYGLAMAGGRLSPVGVPGLLLAGGINFHGNEYGWAADNVVEYEVVLGDGSINNVTAQSNADLFWALKGGSSNFGIVTKFKVNAFPSNEIYAGVYSVSDIPAFLSATANFSAFNTDEKSHIVPQVIAVNENTTVGGAILYYNGDNPSPKCFQPFFDISPISSTWAKKTLAQFAQETGQLVTPGINDMFIAGTTIGKTYDQLLQGIQIVNNAFLNALPDLYKVLPTENRVLLSVDWQPLGKLWKAGSEKVNPGGNPLGFDPSTKGTYLAWAEVIEWTGAEYNDQVNDWVQKTTAAIKKATQDAGLYDAFTYMGDSAGFQDVFDGYGQQNKQKLLDISRKYDPQRVFQKELPGGFKIGK